MMKVNTFKAILFSVFGFLAVASVQAEERVVATVNGFPVLDSQVRAAMGKRVDRQVALERIIDDILVQQAIQESKVQVNNAQVDQIIQNIAAQNGLTFGQFLDALDYQGINYQAYRQQIAQQVLMSEVRNQAIGQSIDVTREDVEKLAQKMLAEAKASGSQQTVTGKQYEVRHILLKLNPMLNDAQAKAQLSQIRADIMAGKISFADAALKYSKDYLSGANGGSLGYMFPDAYAPPFAQTVMSSKQGVISAPFKSEFGWHILEVMNSRDADRTEDAYRQKAYEQLVNKQLQESAQDWTKALRKHANIKYLN